MEKEKLAFKIIEQLEKIRDVSSSEKEEIVALIVNSTDEEYEGWKQVSDILDEISNDYYFSLNKKINAIRTKKFNIRKANLEKAKNNGHFFRIFGDNLSFLDLETKIDKELREIFDDSEKYFQNR